MEEPEDPGGGIPPVGHNIEISNNESSAMDTEDGLLPLPDRKRVRPRKICKTCNKKRRRSGSSHCHSSESCRCDAIITETASTNVHNDDQLSSDANSARIAIQNKSPKTADSATLSVQSQSSNSATPSAVQNQAPDVSSPSPQNRLYVSSDAAPFIIHIQKVQVAPDDRTTLHPVEFGNFLRKNQFKNIINGSLKRIGRNRLSMSFSKHEDANAFLSDTRVSSSNLKAFIPSFNITRVGLVRGVPASWSLEEVQQNISVPIGCGNVIKVRRIKFKDVSKGSVEWKNTETVVITFDGQVLPKRVFICYNSLPVDLYIYPTIQCYNCCRFGHTKLQCRSKPRCFKCGQGHTADSCDVEEDSAICCSCSGYHFATSKSCPEFSRQKDIKKSMAQNCISYAEASKLHPPVSKSFADVVTASLQNQSMNKPANKQITNSQSTKHSYKKTVFLKPRSPPKLSQGYDREAHNSLISEYDMPTPSNGVALNQSNSVNENSNMTVAEIIIALISTLTQCNQIPPSNAAKIFELINQLIPQHGFNKNNPVELSKSHKQEV